MESEKKQMLCVKEANESADFGYFPPDQLLANMKLYQEFLQEETLSEKGREFLNGLGEQTQKLDFLLQSMVKMSRLENGIIQIKRENKNLHHTLTAAVSQIVPSAAEKEIELHVECEERLMLNHDRKWTEEAIFNVLDNAVKYTKAGGKVHVRAVRQEIFTKISIRDNGKGILPERQAEIFTRFYRLQVDMGRAEWGSACI